MILDCCHAGGACRAPLKGRKELLAACGKESDAIAWRLDGSPTFTTKLIEHLKRRKKEAFSVQSLYVDLSTDEELTHSPYHFPFTDPDEPIILSAMQRNLESSPPSSVSSSSGMRALISAHLTGDPRLVMDEWVKWLSTNVPRDVQGVYLECVFQIKSTLVIFSLPIEVWSFLPPNPAYSFIGLVQSRNLLLGPEPFDDHQISDGSKQEVITRWRNSIEPFEGPLKDNASDSGYESVLRYPEQSVPIAHTLRSSKLELVEEEQGEHKRSQYLSSEAVKALESVLLDGKKPLYTSVHVLLLNFKDDDLGVEREIIQLQEVLANEYSWYTERWEIPSSKSQSAMTRKLLQFIEGYDGDDNLLIVYYSGRGFIDKERRLYWAA